MNESVVTHQQFLIARLQDFCRYKDGASLEDPWTYLREKLRECEEPLRLIRQTQLENARDKFVQQLNAKQMNEPDLVEFRTLLNNYLSPGEYPDVAIHLDMRSLANPDECTWVLTMMSAVKAFSAFDEEKKAESVRFNGPKKKINDMTYRLRLDTLDKIMTRKPVTPFRRKMVLRWLRRHVAEFCAVLHVPSEPNDTFNPFMLTQVESLVIALLRFFIKYR